MSHVGPIQHVRRYTGREEIFAIEYPLLCESIPQGIRQSLAPWLREFLGLSNDEASARLKEIWRSTALDPVRPIVEHLQFFTPTSIIGCDGEAYLFLKDLKTATGCVGDEWFLLCPDDPVEVEREIRNRGLLPSSNLLAFMTHFGGLSESLEISGSFSRAANWQVFGTEWTEELAEHTRNRADWEDSVVFYWSRNGDCLLLHSSGKLGWCNHEICEIVDLLPSFEQFPGYYAGYIKKRYPFSSWEPESP